MGAPLDGDVKPTLTRIEVEKERDDNLAEKVMKVSTSAKKVPERFCIQGNTIVFKEVKIEDKGDYMISWCSAVETGKKIFKLDVTAGNL